MLQHPSNHYEESDYEYIFNDHDHDHVVHELLSVSENDNNIENDSKKEINCFICLETNSDILPLQKAYMIQSKYPSCGCKHGVHLNCLDQWYKNNTNKCPFCNTKFHEKYTMMYGSSFHMMFILTMQFFLYFVCLYAFFFLIVLYLYFFSRLL
jgi:hypothetical protein